MGASQEDRIDSHHDRARNIEDAGVLARAARADVMGFTVLVCLALAPVVPMLVELLGMTLHCPL